MSSTGVIHPHGFRKRRVVCFVVRHARTRRGVGEGGTVFHTVQLVSQRDREYENFGCGAASLMMLLCHHRLPMKVPSYPQLCECLWLNVEPEIKGWPRSDGKGAYESDVKRALKGMASPRPNRRHIQFSKIDDADPERALRRIVKALRIGPVMSAMEGKGFGSGEGHWIVITGDEADGLHYLDPWRRRQRDRLSRTEFCEHWSRYGFFLEHPCTCAA